MAPIEKSKSYRGDTVLDRDIWNQRVSAYISEHTVEINSARWSGRQTKEDAVTGIGELIEFLCEVRREILKNHVEPKFKAGTFIRWGMHKRIQQLPALGRMSYFALTAKAEEFNRLDRERHALEMLQRDADSRTPGLHLSDIFGDEKPKSWRAEIVEEEIRRDEMPVVDQSAVCECAVYTGCFFDVKDKTVTGYNIYTCERHEREYLTKRGAK